MKYINEIKEGEQVVEHYLCKSRQTFKSKNDKNYLSLKLADKTGTVDAKVWNLGNEIQSFSENDMIKIDATAQIFNNEIQLNVKRIRRSKDGEYDPADYIPSTEKDIKNMWVEFTSYINTIKNQHIKELLEKIFLKNTFVAKEFSIHSAAKSVHHGYLGGLLEHSLSVTQICDFMADKYKFVDRDVLVASAMLHDVGKPTARVEGPDKDHFKMHPVIGEEMARKILRRLKFDNQTIKQVTTLVRWHDRRFASMEEVNKKTVRRWVSQLTPELFTRLMEVQKADISAQSDYQRDKKEQVLQETKKLFEEIIEEKNCLSIKELKINGKDLMDMGVPQGKEIGQILSWLLDQVLEDPQLNERETLTRMAEEKRDEK